MASANDEERSTQSRRILDRVAREADSGTPSFIAASGRRLRDHVTAVNAEQADPVEYWATRVGRTLGFIVSLVIIVMLVLYVTRGG